MFSLSIAANTSTPIAVGDPTRVFADTTRGWHPASKARIRVVDTFADPPAAIQTYAAKEKVDPKTVHGVLYDRDAYIVSHNSTLEQSADKQLLGSSGSAANSRVAAAVSRTDANKVVARVRADLGGHV